MRLAAGTRIGQYEIVAPIGSGGMGEVYRARDTKLGRDVALKVLGTSVAADPDRLARFRREAQLLAALNHPNIAAIYGFEDASDASQHALVMEFVGGETLADRIAHGAIAIAEALPIARQIAEALETAHELGIIHRDLKPANVKVRDDGTVKVLDFGLAKALAADEASGISDAMNSPTLTARATQFGMILGTAAYMAPEQAKGKPVDRRADIWAFGVVLYEMLTGRRGYHAEDVSDTLAAVLTRDVDWAALPPETPERVRVLLRDCLARDPKQRLRDIGEARRVLERVIAGAPDTDFSSPSRITPASSQIRSPRAVLPWMIAALAVVAAVVMAWLSITARSTPAPRVVTRSKQALQDLSGFVALSRDGTKLAYTVNGAQGFYLMLRRMDEFDGKMIPGADGGQFPIFSPDAEWIAFNAVSSTTPTIKKIPSTGGKPITVCEGSLAIGGGAWGDDDSIVFAGPSGLMRVSANGGAPQALTTADKAKGETAHSRPQFLPGGKRLLFTITSTVDETPQFAILDLPSGTYRTVAKGGLNGRYVPSGHLTFVRSATLFAVPFDLDRAAVTGSEVQLFDGISNLGPVGTADYTASETGLLVYSEATGTSGTLMVWLDRKGNPQQLPGQVPRPWGTGRMSPDGRRLANVLVLDKSKDVWVVDLARGTPTRLTFGGDNDNPIWTPDGTRVAYSSSRDGKFGIDAIAADGSGQPTRLIVTDSPAVPSSFTPDGKTLLFTLQTPTTRRVMVLPLSASTGAQSDAHPLREGTAADSQAAISPDGKWVAFTSTESGAPDIYVLPFPGPGPKVRISTGGGQSARWAPNGRELLYWAGPGRGILAAVTIEPSSAFTASTPQELFKYVPGTTWDVAPDGQRFLVESTRLEGGSTFATVTDWFEELRRRAPVKK